MVSSNGNTPEQSTDKSSHHDDTVTFDISFGPPLDPANVMSTTVPPADDMSITVATAGVVLVYKPRSMRELLVKAAPQIMVSIHPRSDDVRAL